MCGIAGLYTFSAAAPRRTRSGGAPSATSWLRAGLTAWVNGFLKTAASHSATDADAQSFVITGHPWSTQ
jgi:nucleoid-associated protein YgaU